MPKLQHVNNAPKHVYHSLQMPNEFYHHHPKVLVEYPHSTQDHDCAKIFPVLCTSWSQQNEVANKKFIFKIHYFYLLQIE